MVVVETDGPLFLVKNGSTVGSSSGASADVMYSLEISVLDSEWVKGASEVM